MHNTTGDFCALVPNSLCLLTYLTNKPYSGGGSNMQLLFFDVNSRGRHVLDICKAPLLSQCGYRWFAASLLVQETGNLLWLLASHVLGSTTPDSPQVCTGERNLPI